MRNIKVLLVEDDNALREALQETLKIANIEALSFDSAESFLAQISNIKFEEYQLLVTDINLGKLSGLDLLNRVQKSQPELPVLLMTAYGNIEQAVLAMQQGAVDYLLKPFEPKLLLDKINHYGRVASVVDFQAIAVDELSQHVLGLARRVSNTDATVLISGPSGSGKEVLSKYIHQHSNRANQPFVAINCAAIPENMMEATLFGYEKGSFTGAYSANAGKFELAQHGTILLDEISEMPLGLQAKLLRVLQEKEVERIGGKKVIELDVRIIATTNRELEAEVKAGRFREDLYYRLSVFPISISPLKDRIQDIIPLANHLLTVFSQTLKRIPPALSDNAREKLLKYEWPGNVREMGNLMQRALILQSGNIIEAEDLCFNQEFKKLIKFSPNTSSEEVESADTLNGDLKLVESQIIMQKLQEFRGNKSRVAEILGISPRTLRYKLAKMREQGLAV